MKPIIEKLNLSGHNSFLAHTYRTPNFEVPWHQHIEYELIFFKEGEGSSFIGNYVGTFTTGDIFFLGSNLPHTFHKAKSESVTSAVVIQFREDFWGKDFMQLPESHIVRQLFQTACQGLKIKGNYRERLIPFIEELEFAEGFERIILLCECLQMIAQSKEYETVSTQEVKAYNTKHRERIDKIYQYTIDHFQEPVSLTDVARHAGMSMPAFCNYFKKSTKKTYIDFLHELRIGHACKQLINNQKTIESICYNSGFNTLANFNKQFLKVRQTTPSKYRKKFLNRHS